MQRKRREETGPPLGSHADLNPGRLRKIADQEKEEMKVKLEQETTKLVTSQMLVAKLQPEYQELRTLPQPLPVPLPPPLRLPRS